MGTEAEIAQQSTALIRELLNVEKEAEDIIANAKKERLAKLRTAKDKADQDITKVKGELEAKFNKEHGEKARDDPGALSKEATEKELQMVTQDYNANKVQTIDYICKKVMDVKAGLTSTQIQSLKTGLV